MHPYTRVDMHGKPLYRSLLLLLLVWLPLFATAAMAENNDAAIEAAFELFKTKSFDDKAKGVELIAQSGDERSKAILNALLVSRLFIKKDDNQIVIGEKTDNQYQITSALTAEDLGLFKKRKLKKIGINNALRSQIRNTLASIDLSDSDPAVRLAAIKSMSGNIDETSLSLFRTILEQENNTEVKEALQTALAIAQLDSPEQQVRLDAIAQVSGNLNPAIRAKLAQLEQDPTHPEIAKAAKRALDDISFKLQLFSVLETLFFGVSLGSVLVLAAIGLAITFGVMGVINMAHGELIMLGAYTTYLIQQLMPDYAGVSLLLVDSRRFYRLRTGGNHHRAQRDPFSLRPPAGDPAGHLRHQPDPAAAGAQHLISPQNVPVSNPEWMSGAAADQQRAVPDLQPALHHPVLPAGVRRPVSDPETHRPGVAGARGVAEPGHGPRHGRALRAGGCPDLRPRFRHRRCGRRGTQPADQRWPQPGPGLYHRLLHGGGVRRCRQPLGHPGGRSVPGQSPTRYSSPGPGRCWRRSWCWCSSSCSSKNARADCSRRRAVLLED